MTVSCFKDGTLYFVIFYLHLVWKLHFVNFHYSIYNMILENIYVVQLPDKSTQIMFFCHFLKEDITFLRRGSCIHKCQWDPWHVALTLFSSMVFNDSVIFLFFLMQLLCKNWHVHKWHVIAKGFTLNEVPYWNLQLKSNISNYCRIYYCLLPQKHILLCGETWPCCCLRPYASPDNTIGKQFHQEKTIIY